MEAIFPKSQAKEQNQALYFFLLSIFVHALLLLFAGLRGTMVAVQRQAEPVPVEFVEVTRDSFDAKKQIVETTLAEKSEKAAKDAFLGAQTQTVDHQTKAQTNASFREAKASKSASAERTAKQSQTPSSSSKSDGEALPKQGTLALSGLGVKMDFKPLGNLGPPGTTASTSDYLKDTELGAQTLLNTKEFAYFSYYQRVRRQLEQFWEPGLRQRLRRFYDRGRQLASDKEHATKLLVVMNKEGTITRVQIQDTSGVTDVDQAAVDAFNKAGPFPNPPHGMIESDGTVKIEWEFILRT